MTQKDGTEALSTGGVSKGHVRAKSAAHLSSLGSHREAPGT